MSRRVALSLKLYRVLANAFPYEFKNAYGEELLLVTEEAVEPIWRRHGAFGLLRLLLDIAIRVPIEHGLQLRQDIRYGLRALAGSPGFTAVALISLSLGICIATCALSEMNGMVLRDLPGVANPHELTGLELPVSFPDYRRYRDLPGLWTSTFAYIAPVPFGVTVGTHTEKTWGHLVTPSYFSTLGVHASLGRVFDREHEQPGQSPDVVFSYRFWQEHLGSDPSILGKSVRINGQSSTVIGIGPKNFLGASPLILVADLWMPVSVGGRVAPELADNALERPVPIFHMVGRLKPGVSVASAEAALDSAARQIERENGAARRDRKDRRVLLVAGGKLLPLRNQDKPFFTSFLIIMAGLVMLIACANVANMLLARGTSRRKEIAIRLSLGAGRARLVRQLLTESMLVSAGAAVLGFLLSAWLMRLLRHVRMPLPMPVAYDFQPDGRVMLFTVVLALATGVGFGLLPALQSTRIAAPIRRHRRLSMRNLLMVSQLAGSLTLLVILGLLSFGIQTTIGMQAGFDPRNLYLLSLDPIRDGYSAAQASAFFSNLLDRVERLPSVRKACLTETVPVSLPGSSVTFSAPGGVTRNAFPHVVGKDYFETTGIPILRGRWFRREDEADQATAIIVNEELVRQLWEGQDPLGRRIEIGNGEATPAKVLPGSFDYRSRIAGERQTFEVVGVAGNVAEGLVVGERRAVIYFPLRSADYRRPSLTGITLMVKAAPGVDALSAVQREISTLDANVTQFNARSMLEQIDQFVSPLRTTTWTYGLVGVFGLVLACVGLAGVTAYSVSQRGHEIGIRMALGARNRDVLALVMRESSALVTVGTLLGLAGAWAGARGLAAISSAIGKVTSTSTNDPVVLYGAPLLLAGLALLACYLPARRSTQIDPAAALRQD